ncbi:cbb3-type cytochrome c oxidase N-terminal domain-containing protein [Flavihumibacter profundi]|uniref:cbb3-type cytochrome c oxidase N-terminal domain-containing protein n=1 Tax=Flavihumibacter profundi TaxID=2716883 RepID=UPI001CC72E4B|nr:cbb3-type cytochrome c oxidase N-terminal domain-containing protein [Flavihumibacter profundi]MBZ5859510.1 c-type cytochrome [Flavihumibacter profundi]
MFFSDQIKGKLQAGTKAMAIVLFLLAASATAWAKGATGPAPTNALENPLAITLLIIISALALILALLAWVVNGAAGVFLGRSAKESEPGSSSSSTIISILLVLLMVSPATFAQDAAAEAGQARIGGMDPIAFYFMLFIIGIELVGILYLIYNLQLLIRAEKAKVISVETAEAAGPKINWWSKFNRFRPVEQEADIDLGHDYDGIRELDNRLPPWWLYGFYLTIIVGVIYLWRYHVVHTAPSSKEEYEIAMNKAAAEQEEYLKKSASKVDENTVVMLDAGGIAAGQSTFITNCAACHGKLGEGGVGPNLTDDYWIHGGKINDIFKTIKYGYPEKGMKSWKDDLSPVKIAQLASFIKSIHGTNPPNGKEKQGDLYTESGTPESTAVPKDSTANPNSKDSTTPSRSAK